VKHKSENLFSEVFKKFCQSKITKAVLQIIFAHICTKIRARFCYVGICHHDLLWAMFRNSKRLRQSFWTISINRGFPSHEKKFKLQLPPLQLSNATSFALASHNVRNRYHRFAKLSFPFNFLRNGLAWVTKSMLWTLGQQRWYLLKSYNGMLQKIKTTQWYAGHGNFIFIFKANQALMLAMKGFKRHWQIKQSFARSSNSTYCIFSLSFQDRFNRAVCQILPQGK